MELRFMKPEQGPYSVHNALTRLAITGAYVIIVSFVVLLQSKHLAIDWILMWFSIVDPGTPIAFACVAFLYWIYHRSLRSFNVKSILDSSCFSLRFSVRMKVFDLQVTFICCLIPFFGDEYLFCLCCTELDNTVNCCDITAVTLIGFLKDPTSSCWVASRASTELYALQLILGLTFLLCMHILLRYVGP